MQELLFKKLNSVKLSTPFFVFLPNEIDYNLLILRDTLNKYFRNFEILYSLKTNYLLSIVSYLIKKTYTLKLSLDLSII